MRKISKLLLSISLVISLLVACGGVVLADSTTPTETSYVSQSTAMGADWEKYYGKTGYVILAGSGGTFYSNMYSDYSGTEVIKGKCVNYGIIPQCFCISKEIFRHDIKICGVFGDCGVLLGGIWRSGERHSAFAQFQGVRFS